MFTLPNYVQYFSQGTVVVLVWLEQRAFVCPQPWTDDLAEPARAPSRLIDTLGLWTLLPDKLRLHAPKGHVKNVSVVLFFYWICSETSSQRGSSLNYPNKNWFFLVEGDEGSEYKYGVFTISINKSPSATSLVARWQVTGDRWQVTGNKWQVTGYRW